MPDDLYEIAPHPAGSKDAAPAILLRLHVQPGAGRNAIMGRHGDALKVKVGAPPEGGRANAAVLTLIAASLGVAESEVTLESGATSRNKRLRIVGLEAPECGRRLDLAIDDGNGGGRRSVDRHAP